MKVTHKTKSIITIIIVALCSTNTLFSIISIPNASAESFQSSQTVYFTFNPTISITTSGDLVIESLTPGDYKDSNIITVTASSNAVAGYSLTSTVGTSTNTSNELRKDGTDTTNIFSNLTANQSTLSNFSDNTWGYSYSLDSGSTWISGSTGDTATGYNGYTYDTSTSTSETITHLSSTTSGSSTIQYKIGAKASTTQIAGEYTNVINFIGVANPDPPIVYMQSATLADCGKDMVDIRDNNVYATALLADNKCWLLDNLRLDPTDHTTAINMNEDNTNATSEAIDNYLHGSETAPETGWSTTKVTSFIPTGAEGETFNSYTKPVINSQYPYRKSASYGKGSGTMGVYYDYCAATVGTYCYMSSAGVGDASQDVCPAHWRMPTGGPDGEYQNLCDIIYGSTCSDTTSMTGTDDNSLQYNLSTTLSGNYHVNRVNNLGSVGFFWSSTRRDGTNIYVLSSKASSVYPQSRMNREIGLPVRCLLSRS